MRLAKYLRLSNNCKLSALDPDEGFPAAEPLEFIELPNILRLGAALREKVSYGS